MTPKSWDGWKQRFEAAGHEVIVPGWPGVTDDVAAMRADPSALNGLRISTVVDSTRRSSRHCRNHRS